MRANPTPASGPVSIKHVRNTVPTALPATATPPGVLTNTASGSLVHLTPSELSQLEETSL